MSAAALAGFLLGLSLIVAIGAQNAFVLRQGLVRRHVLALCLVCSLSDAALIAAGVAGLGAFITAQAWLIRPISLAGAGFLYVYAALALRRAVQSEALTVAKPVDVSLNAAVATCLALTFLNPHVYLDTVVLLGSLSARYTSPAAKFSYGAGATAASIVWFFALGYGARLLAPLFARPVAWRILDLVIAAVMGGLATSLLVGMR
ncbi:LysE/ArgO family amino acid transporter [Mangrovibrevibacter kandeliae]|uniref:LysE/ArgO family amino acid transporter n=1 Tax=Mangrovibrevibacter kandeliae TaxID=2968473 RepID=UPI002117BAF9|nr:LysE/ArgO family amino acid transporter [Aurantimonas sp. CSK15Z-1]MCQ8781161.1 LysE/ArgO family amino acid transporter [Aurantimonas sp. CSK15Z-1]